MNKEIKIVAGVGLAASTVVGAYILNNRELKVDERGQNMFSLKDVEKTLVEVGEDVGVKDVSALDNLVKPSLSPIEVEKINGMIQGMSEQELRVALRNIPVGLMFDEIGARLTAHEQFAMHIQDALNCLPR